MDVIPFPLTIQPFKVQNNYVECLNAEAGCMLITCTLAYHTLKKMVDDNSCSVKMFVPPTLARCKEEEFSALSGNAFLRFLHKHYIMDPRNTKNKNWIVRFDSLLHIINNSFRSTELREDYNSNRSSGAPAANNNNWNAMLNAAKLTCSRMRGPGDANPVNYVVGLQKRAVPEYVDFTTPLNSFP